MNSLFELIDFDDIETKKPEADKSAPGENHSADEIAIIGAAVKLPRADNLRELWNNLLFGISACSDFPDQRYRDIENWFKCRNIRLTPQMFKKGNYLTDIDKFDYDFFGLSADDANMMDPLHRLLLETFWNCLEDGGYCMQKVSGTCTGIYVGFNNDDIERYSRMLQEKRVRFTMATMENNLSSILASRLSYLLNLKGPAMLIDTACSSSLCALHIACQGLKNEDCEMALVGGINIGMVPIKYEGFRVESESDTLSPFDDSADGTVVGEGVVSLLLKPLRYAVRDRDHVYAVIISSAINQDGMSVGISAPNAVAQRNVMVNAWEKAGINPEEISYMEAHGTGTKLGDVIEMEGIRQAFERYTDRKQFCGIGSVKANIGHIEGASGLAGVVKLMLSLQNRVIPKTIAFNRPNHSIAFEDSPVFLVDRLTPWESTGGRRTCGISSFGLSGTNCHAVLREFSKDAPVSPEPAESAPYLLAVSAKSAYSFQQLLRAYAELLVENPAIDLESMCYTAGYGRDHHRYRAAFVFTQKRELLDALKSAWNGDAARFDTNGLLRSEEKEALDREADRLVLDASQKRGGECHQSYLDISRLYCRGAAVNWKLLYKNRAVKTLSLPVYPFERHRCWI
ncbi:type I polyketide synthase [Ethanoligenens harbinense]|uniref:type I polyketide synthase n=1 Tax=Ethanoligenens harbinense TaxID=253239 RepID=UPI0010C018FC|nr:polyketide synthase [Ethanoligenens harbinense]QCN91263.1 hypothetical protein DRA42_01395 [Ethanoligenens harbinense]